MRRFGLKTGIDFAHFGLESGMVTRELRACMNIFTISIPMIDKEREICKFLFSCSSNLSNDDVISLRPGPSCSKGG